MRRTYKRTEIEMYEDSKRGYRRNSIQYSEEQYYEQETISRYIKTVSIISESSFNSYRY